MRFALSALATLVWSLWLGGLMALFLLVSNLFAVDRSTAVLAAPRMFLAFERYQLLLAAVLLLVTALWRITTPRALLTALFVIFAVASIGPIASSTVISPKMHRLREAGQSSGPDFRRLHGHSMIVYTSNAAVLLVGGVLLIAAMRRTTPATAPASAPPAEPVDPALSH